MRPSRQTPSSLSQRVQRHSELEVVGLVFVAPDQPDALAEALQSLIHNPARRHLLGQRARQRARQFTPERMAWHYLRLYRRLSAAHRNERPRPLWRVCNPQEAL